MISRYKPANMDNIILVQSPMTVTRGKCFQTHLTCLNETCSALSLAPSPHHTPTGDDNQAVILSRYPHADVF